MPKLNIPQMKRFKRKVQPNKLGSKTMDYEEQKKESKVSEQFGNNHDGSKFNTMFDDINRSKTLELSKSSFPVREVEETMVFNSQDVNILDSLEVSEQKPKKKSPRKDRRNEEGQKEVLDLKKFRENILGSTNQKVSKQEELMMSQRMNLSQLKAREGEVSYYMGDVHNHLLFNFKDTQTMAYINHMNEMLLVLQRSSSYQPLTRDELDNHRSLIIQKHRPLFNDKLGKDGHLPDISFGAKPEQVVRFKDIPMEEKLWARFKEQETVIDKWLLLDLDETLVHASFQPTDDYTFQLLLPDGTKQKVKVVLRPFVFEFLERMRGVYKLALFTSATRVYAEKMASILDPGKNIFKMVLSAELLIRTTYMDRCVKDLRIFEGLIDPRKVLLVEHKMENMVSQLENCVPVLPFKGAAGDFELLKLSNYLMSISGDSHMVETNSRYFKFKRLKQVKRVEMAGPILLNPKR